MTSPPPNTNCPKCGEPLQPNWKICPACEASLTPLVCPQCGIPVRENWKRCPECEHRLVREALPSEGGGPGEVLVEPVVGISFIRVPGGSFVMGDTFGEGIPNEQPVHTVHLDSFFIGKFSVTQTQWKTLMPENPARFRGEVNPVEQVTWEDAQNFIRCLTEANGGKFAFHLPTEAQWEFAARSGGREEKFAGGDDFEKFAWCEENSAGTTHPVGTRTPNGLGICDMSGNVWEWCLDIFREDAYETHAERNPVCLEGATDRVIRGGSWNIDAWNARCARRFCYLADFWGPGLGFRLVMAVRSTGV